jgi:hypothetical protein
MRLPWQKRRDDNVTGGLAEARAERLLSQERLAAAKRDVIEPLHETRQKMRDHNHVSDYLDSLISRRARERRHDAPEH